MREASVVVLLAVFACENERPLADALLRVDAGQTGPSGGAAGGPSAADASAPAPDAATPPDASQPAEPDASRPSVCEQASQRFRDFVAANRSCSASSDCTMIGDCGPNADFQAVEAAAAAAGYELMMQRCGGIFDGPTYASICQDGQCVQGPPVGCCGCPLDAGLDDG